MTRISTPGPIRRSKLPWVTLRGSSSMQGCPNPCYSASSAGLLRTWFAFCIFTCRLLLSIAIQIPFGIKNLLCLRRKAKVFRVVHRNNWLVYEWGAEGLYNDNSFRYYPEHYFMFVFSDATGNWAVQKLT